LVANGRRHRLLCVYTPNGLTSRRRSFGRPELHEGLRGPRALPLGRAYALRRWLGILSGFTPSLSESLGKIEAFAIEYGRPLPAAFARAHHQYIYVCDDRNQGHRRAVAYLGQTYAQDFDRLVDSLCVVGSVDHCVQRLVDFVGAGVRHVILRPMADNEELLLQLQIYAGQIIPAVRQASGSV
jgi:alkanesulfonate monooxygenase SsuD/methylene tetrahydromethanopterin reductase-like flavin-dependent oxidoreductase (luciferase family)